MEHLNDLNEIFEHVAILVALQENRELQFRNCWNRLMDSLDASSALVGSKYIQLLNELLAIVYQRTKGYAVTSTSTDSMPHQIENCRIARKIVHFLDAHGPKSRAIDYSEIFEHLVVQTFRMLIEKTKHVMIDIQMLKLASHRTGFIIQADAKILNGNKLCNRILVDAFSIKTEVLQYASNCVRFDKAYEQQQSLRQSGEAINEQTRDLITQYLSLNANELGQIFVESFTDTQLEPAPKRANFDHSIRQVASASLDQMQTERPDSELKFVIRILAAKGPGRYAKFITVWSEGSESLETKDFLMINA